MTTLMLLSFITASAYDFMVDGLAYNVVSLPDLTCEVAQADTEYSGDIVIPSTVTYQGRTLTVIRIGGNDSEKGAFYKCSALTSVEIPNSVTTIGTTAFNGCSALTSIEIPSSVTEIGDYAFGGCSALTSVEIPNSIKWINPGVFAGCKAFTSVKIPTSVTWIGGSAFSNCSLLTTVEIPNSVTAIYSGAFYNCSSLTTVEIPNSVTAIYSETFYECSSLTSIVIPNSVTKIGKYAFRYCSSLTSVVIPNSETWLDDLAFGDCPLKSIIWGPKGNISFNDRYGIEPFENTSLEYLEILPSVSESIKIIGSDKKTRPELPSLKKLSLGRSLLADEIGSALCPALTDLELTGHVKSFEIGGAPSIKNLTIDNGVELTTGAYGAYMSKYDKLECITMKGDVPRFIPTFAHTTYFNAKLRVPKGTLQAYQNAEGWENFWNIEEYEVEVGIDEVPVEVGDKTECGRYDLHGRPVDDTYRGVTIIRYTDGSARKVMTTR